MNLGNKIYIYIRFSNLYIFIYKRIKMNDVSVKMTTVKIIRNVYSKFKKTSTETNLSLQKLVNRTIELYVTDEEFRKKIDNFKHLEEVSGSHY